MQFKCECIAPQMEKTFKINRTLLFYIVWYHLYNDSVCFSDESSSGCWAFLKPTDWNKTLLSINIRLSGWEHQLNGYNTNIDIHHGDYFVLYNVLLTELEAFSDSAYLQRQKQPFVSFTTWNFFSFYSSPALHPTAFPSTLLTDIQTGTWKNEI